MQVEQAKAAVGQPGQGVDLQKDGVQINGRPVKGDQDAGQSGQVKAVDPGLLQPGPDPVNRQRLKRINGQAMDDRRLASGQGFHLHPAGRAEDEIKAAGRRVGDHPGVGLPGDGLGRLDQNLINLAA